MLMCMCMLTKRTNILFEDELWNMLKERARVEQISVGELVRNTLREKYGEEKRLVKRRKAIESILAFREKHGKRLAQGEDSTVIIRKMREERYGKDHLRRL